MCIITAFLFSFFYRHEINLDNIEDFPRLPKKMKAYYEQIADAGLALIT